MDNIFVTEYTFSLNIKRHLHLLRNPPAVQYSVLGEGMSQKIIKYYLGLFIDVLTNSQNGVERNQNNKGRERDQRPLVEGLLSGRQTRQNGRFGM